MFKRLLSAGRVAAPAGLALGLMLGAQPVLADTELGHTGTVGTHSLHDTANYEGAGCHYLWNTQQDIAYLKSIDVNPPRMKAVVGNNHQTVGWQAIVQRRWGSNGTSPAWTVTFTSVERTATTNATTNALFNQWAHINVTLPFGAAQHQSKFAQYRVVVKMIWHNSNGTTQGTAMHRVDHYFLELPEELKSRTGNCLGYDPSL